MMETKLKYQPVKTPFTYIVIINLNIRKA